MLHFKVDPEKPPSEVRLASYDAGFACTEASALFKSPGNKRDQVLESVGPRRKHDDAEIEASQMLLMRQALVRRQKDVELFLCRCKQGAIF